MNKAIAAQEARSRLSDDLRAISAEIWSVFRPVAVTARYRVEAASGTLFGPTVHLDGSIWPSLEEFDGEAMSLGDGVDGGARLFNVTILPAEGRGGGRTAQHDWMKALDHLLAEIVDAQEIGSAAALAQRLDDAFEDLGMPPPADSAKWIRDNLPKLNARAKDGRGKARS